MTERPYTPEVDSLVWQYRGRRTVAADLVRRIEEAVRLDVATAVAHAQGELDAARIEHERLVARLEQRSSTTTCRLEQRVEDLRKDRDAQAAALKAYREKQTNLREYRETIDDGTLVRIQAPRVTTYGDKTAPRPWTLEEVETIVYRLRMAGGQDDTEVRFKHEHVEATVPFPEYALEPVQRTAVVADLELAPPRWLVAVNAALASPVLVWGLVLLVVSMVVGMVVTR